MSKDKPALTPDLEDSIPAGIRNARELRRELEQIFNRLCIDSQLNTPDYMLAEHVVSSLFELKDLIDRRRVWGCK